MRWTKALGLFFTMISAACGDDTLHNVEGPAGRFQDAHGRACVPDEATLAAAVAMPDLAGCVKLEGAQIGEDAWGTVGEVRFSVQDWVAKDDAPNEYVGFELTTTGALHYFVKAGTELFEGTTNAWVHPAGTGGRTAHAISFLALCPGGAVAPSTPAPADLEPLPSEGTIAPFGSNPTEPPSAEPTTEPSDDAPSTDATVEDTGGHHALPRAPWRTCDAGGCCLADRT